MSAEMENTREPAMQADVNRALANAVGRCYRRLAGRGPTMAKAVYHGDIVVVVLQGILTIGERTLVAEGRQTAVRQLRDAMHEAMNAELTGLIEAQT
jgi:uncharacterized protein YbcI